MKRNRWTEKELQSLKTAYGSRKVHAVNLPQHLAIRHGVCGCYVKAYRLGITSQCVPRRLGIHKWLDTEISYLAGIIDGEGCIYDGTKAKQGCWSLVIATTDISLFEWLKKLDRGCSYMESRNRKPNHKQVYVFRANALNDVLEILEFVEPYLIIKKDRANVAIDYIKTYLGNIS